jgi:hypothetical protein
MGILSIQAMKGMAVGDGFVLPIRKDVNLEQFLRLLKAKRDRAPDGVACYDCSYFRVSATLTGRFFAGGWGARII